jgi:hypothetical protein
VHGHGRKILLDYKSLPMSWHMLISANVQQKITQGGYYGNALQAASAGGHETVVRLLLKKGADANAQGGYYGNALQAASAGGHETVVRLLLEKGADVNTQGGYYGNALQAASTRRWYGCYSRRVRILIRKEESMAMHSRRHQLKVMRRWCGCCSRRVRI